MPVTKSSKNKSATTKAAASGSAAARKKTAAKPASAARKSAVKKAPVVKKPAAKKAPAKSKPAAKKTPGGKSATKPSAKKTVVKKPAAKKPVAKKAPVKKAAPKPAVRTAAPAPKKVLPAKKPLAINPDQPAPSFGFSGPLKGFKPYQPTPREEYMSDKMREHFRDVLTAWKQELMEEVDRTVHHMKDEAANFPDPNDRATQESEFGLELRTRDRERKLLKKIEQALARIEDGTYGYCSETGEEIGLRRLEARPVATLTVEAQERRELAEKQYRDRDDR